MKKLFYLFVATAAIGLVACGPGSDDPENPSESVTINGVKWATRNVGEPGKFVDNPEDYGEFYTFEEAQTACPEGWRTPTKEEFEILATVSSEWTTLNGVTGRRFGSGSNFIFLPAAGNRNTDGSVSDQGTYGRYWSSTAFSAATGHSLSFTSSSVLPSYYNSYANGFGVRCVRQ